MSLAAATAHLAAAVPPPAAAPVKQIDVIETGRVLATLDDWRSLMLVQLTVIGILVLVLVALVGFIVWMATRRSANDQATLQALQDNTKALGEMSASTRAMEVILSRLEAGEA